MSRNRTRGHFNLLWVFDNFLVKCFDLMKNPKGGPFYVKKMFISDFSQISCVEFLGHKSIKFQVSWKLEIKIFFGFFSLKTDHFQINTGGKGSGGGCCHSKITIKIGLYFDFHMVPSLPARPQFLAMLTAKQSNGGDGGLFCPSKFGTLSIEIRHCVY